MALSSKISDALLGGRSQAFLSDGLYDLVFDVVLDYQETDASKLSKHTIEEGADIADHLDNDPMKINISAILTDDDYDLLDPSGFFDDTIEDRIDTLDYWKETKPLLTYFGHEYDIEDVVITNVVKQKNQSTGSGLQIAVTLERVTIASFMLSTISLSAAAARGATARGSSSRSGSATTTRRSILERGWRN